MSCLRTSWLWTLHRGEDFFELLEAVLEDVADIALDEVFVDEWCEDPAFGFVEDGVVAVC